MLCLLLRIQQIPGLIHRMHFLQRLCLLERLKEPQLLTLRHRVWLKNIIVPQTMNALIVVGFVTMKRIAKMVKMSQMLCVVGIESVLFS